jgi:hypothetical protein
MKEPDDDDSDSDSTDGDVADNQEVCMVESEDRPIDLASGRIPLVRQRDVVKRPLTPMKTSSDGRFVVEESDSEEETAEATRPQQHKRVSLADLAELRDKSNALKKAKLAENATLRNGGIAKKTTRQESQKKSKRTRRKHEVIGLTQFAPGKKTAYGDAKRSTNDTDPYAYVRLNPSLIREKYRGNALEALSQVVRKTGEKAGRKIAKGRSGVTGGLFLQKPSFKKPSTAGLKKTGMKKRRK